MCWWIQKWDVVFPWRWAICEACTVFLGNDIVKIDWFWLKWWKVGENRGEIDQHSQKWTISSLTRRLNWKNLVRVQRISVNRIKSNSILCEMRKYNSENWRNFQTLPFSLFSSEEIFWNSLWKNVEWLYIRQWLRLNMPFVFGTL